MADKAVTHRGSRIIYRFWPRDPNGVRVRSTVLLGKRIDEGHLAWGATLDNFFRTQPIPRDLGDFQIVTSSKMVAHCSTHRETRHAAHLISEARREASPVEILPYDIAKILREHDLDIRQREDEVLAPKIQQRIPFHLLPEKLLVHDPDDTLEAHSYGHTSRGLTTPRTYELSPVSCTEYAVKDESLTHGILLVSKQWGVPPIFVEYPPRPLPPATPDAHLFLAARLGTGHHSYVYRGEWEVPRSLLIEPNVCQTCALEVLLKTLKATSPDIGLDGAALENMLAHLLGFPDPDDAFPFDVVDIHEPKVDFVKRRPEPQKTVPISIAWSSFGHFFKCEHLPANIDRDLPFDEREARDGTIPTSSYRNPPSTFKMTVAVKMSMQYDSHLLREAQNYEEFPDYFFQHWSGYGMVPPLQRPTPCGAIVPQFYGYYTPARGEAKGRQYLSPILLIEDCGKPIEPKTMSHEDRLECASLVRRMTIADWMHNSVYQRNIVVDYGRISDHPSVQAVSNLKRFRLIDFGRTEQDGQREDVKFNDQHTWEHCDIPTVLLQDARDYVCFEKTRRRTEPVQLVLPVVYPGIQLYRPVYPHLEIYPQLPERPLEDIKVYLAAKYPTFDLYRPVYPHFDIYPALPQDVAKRPKAPPFTFIVVNPRPKTKTQAAVGPVYPMFDLYPAVYPFFDLYPALPERVGSYRPVPVPVRCRIDARYPSFDIYPAVYPNIDIYPAIPLDVHRPFVTRKVEPADTHIAPALPALDDLEDEDVPGDVPQTMKYPYFNIYPPVYPHLDIYPAIPADLLSRPVLDSPFKLEPFHSQFHSSDSLVSPTASDRQFPYTPSGSESDSYMYYDGSEGEGECATPTTKTAGCFFNSIPAQLEHRMQWLL